MSTKYSQSNDTSIVANKFAAIKLNQQTTNK